MEISKFSPIHNHVLHVVLVTDHTYNGSPKDYNGDEHFLLPSGIMAIVTSWHKALLKLAVMPT